MKTIDFYNNNADRFYDETVDADMSAIYAHFEKYIPKGGHILDCGCGSGRDSKYYMNNGYEVTAMDASSELCKRASVLIRKEVECKLFMDITYDNTFDGIWACASLLHETIDNLPVVFQKLANAIKKNGIIYVSFKYGDFSGERNGRFFTDMNELSLNKLIENTELYVTETWITGDVRIGRGDERWLNAILKK